MEEFLKELRKHLSKEDYKDDPTFIDGFLKHDKDHFCIVVHVSDKKLHHVNIDIIHVVVMIPVIMNI